MTRAPPRLLLKLCEALPSRPATRGTSGIPNHALAGIPAERVRYHTCYGINMGPRVHDLELKHIVDIMLHVNAGAYSLAMGAERSSIG